MKELGSKVSGTEYRITLNTKMRVIFLAIVASAVLIASIAIRFNQIKLDSNTVVYMMISIVILAIAMIIKSKEITLLNSSIEKANKLNNEIRIITKEIEENNEVYNIINDNIDEIIIEYNNKLEIINKVYENSIIRLNSTTDKTSKDAINIADVLYEKLEDRNEFKDANEIIFNSNTSLDVAMNRMGYKAYSTKIQDKWYSIKYEHNKKENIIVVVLNNIDEMKQKEDEENEIVSNKILIFKVLQNKNMLHTYIMEMTWVIDVIKYNSNRDVLEYDEVIAKLDTVISNLKQIGFKKTAIAIQKVITILIDSQINGSKVDWNQVYRIVNKEYMQELMVIETYLGKEWITNFGSIIIPKEKYEDIEKYIEAYSNKIPAEIEHLIKQYGRIAFKDISAILIQNTNVLAEKHGRTINQLQINIIGDVKVERSIGKKLAIIIRRYIEHVMINNLESKYIRIERDKSENATIKLEVKEDNNRLHITIIDDGYGAMQYNTKEQAWIVKQIGMLNGDIISTPKEWEYTITEISIPKAQKWNGVIQ